MKKMISIWMAFWMIFLCAGCASGHPEDVLGEAGGVLETKHVEGTTEMKPAEESAGGKPGEESTDIPKTGHGETEGLMQEDFVRLQVFTSEDVKVTPEIVQYDYESACEKGKIISQVHGTLPGAAEGTWYTIAIGGVEYYYGRYDFSPDRTELFGYGYAIVGEEHSLANGISVGMTKSEVMDFFPAMAIQDMDDNIFNGVIGCLGWNPAAYPRSRVCMDEKLGYVDGKDYCWADQFEYMMIANVEQPLDTLPIYVALMMKDDTVSAITFYYPTAD